MEVVGKLNASYALWRAEMKEPVPESDRQTRTDVPALMSGYWRINRARTKPDTPLAIWTQEGEAHTIFQFGNSYPKNTLSDAARWQDFLDKQWFHTTAITREAWERALVSGKFDDGKDAREFSEEEKLDLIPNTPAAQGGNNPVGEDGAPIDLFHQQVAAKIDAEIAKWKALQPLDTLDKANAAAGIRDTLRLLWKQADGRKKEEDAPWNDKLAVIEDKWGHYLRDSKSVATDIFEAIDVFKRAELQRLKREADERERLERERIAEEARKEAAQHGLPVDEAEVASRVEEHIAATPAPVIEAPRVGTAYGRAVSKARVRTGDITDIKAFLLYLLDQGDTELLALLQKRANALARVGVKAPGMEIKTE